MLNSLQNQHDKSGKGNNDRIILEIYMDDCNISAISENELSEIKENLPDVPQAKGLIARASAYRNNRDPLEHLSSGFINTASILKKAEYSSIDDTDDDSNNSNPFSNDTSTNITKDSKKAKVMAAKLEDNQNIYQEKEAIASGKASAIRDDSTNPTEFNMEIQCWGEIKAMAKSKDVSVQDIKEGFYDAQKSIEELSINEGVHENDLFADEEGFYDTHSSLEELSGNAEVQENDSFTDEEAEDKAEQSSRASAVRDDSTNSTDFDTEIPYQG